MKVPVAWLREFVAVPDDPAEVARRLASCGFAVESIVGDVVDVEVTANRPDCLSIYGIGREAAVAFDLPLAPPPTGLPAPTGATPVTLSIDDPGCGRYALAVADVVVGPSPEWLALRLVAAGVRPINNVVDVTNYVMLETGHPMHAFDAAKLSGPAIHVRRAHAGERLTTLDGESRLLDETMLVIADRDAAVAVAGVMGGAGSEVSAATKRVAIESAWFSPASVRATSRKLGLKTEASARFERGADLAAPVAALLSALKLLQTIGAGTASAGLLDHCPRVPVSRRVTLRSARVGHLLGSPIPDADIRRVLEKLGFGLTPAEGGVEVEVPSFRVDVTREADLIEEVGRHWGFDRIPATLPPLREPPPEAPPAAALEARLRGLARGAGLQEAVTFTFIERAAAEPFVPAGGRLVAIANPLSEKFAVLRPSLLAGLVDALVYNRRREAEHVRLFEIGSVFGPASEATCLGWVLTGSRFDHWSGDAGPMDVFDASGLAELFAQAAGCLRHELSAAVDDDLPWFVRGRRARLFVETARGRVPVGLVGQIRPDIVSARGLDAGVVLGGEIDLAALGAVERDRGQRPLTPIPRFPSIVRDLSIIVSERLPAAEVRGTIRSNAPHTLASIGEFDRYAGKGVPDGHVSVSVRLTFRHAERTLTDGEVQQAVDTIVRSLETSHGAVLRGK